MHIKDNWSKAVIKSQKFWFWLTFSMKITRAKLRLGCLNDTCVNNANWIMFILMKCRPILRLTCGLAVFLIVFHRYLLTSLWCHEPMIKRWIVETSSNQFTDAIQLSFAILICSSERFLNSKSWQRVFASSIFLGNPQPAVFAVSSLTIRKFRVRPLPERGSSVLGDALRSTLCILDKVQSSATHLISNPSLSKFL